jgi:hypothetical protein
MSQREAEYILKFEAKHGEERRKETHARYLLRLVPQKGESAFVKNVPFAVYTCFFTKTLSFYNIFIKL